MAEIFGSLGAKASNISGSVGLGFRLAKQQYQKGYDKLDSKAKNGVDKVIFFVCEIFMLKFNYK